MEYSESSLKNIVWIFCVCFVHDQNDMNKTKQGLQFQYIDFTTI